MSGQFLDPSRGLGMTGWRESVGERADVTDWQCWASPRSYFECLPPQADLRQHERPHTGDELTPRRTFSLPLQE